MLEPDPEFNYQDFGYSTAVNCNNNLTYFNVQTKKWDCPWDANTKTNWLTTDGTNMVVDTSKAPSYISKYEVKT
jgi:hypothetical protein